MLSTDDKSFSQMIKYCHHIKTQVDSGTLIHKAVSFMESRENLGQYTWLFAVKFILFYCGMQEVWSQGGTCQNLDRDARSIFLGLRFGQILFFWVGKFFSYFSGFRKISTIFLDLTNFQLFFWVFQFLYHTLESFE